MSRLRFLVGALVLLSLSAALAQPDRPPTTPDAPSAAPWSAYAQSLAYLASPTLHKELGADEATTKKLAEHRGTWTKKYQSAVFTNLGDEMKMRGFFQEHEKALGEILKPEQMTRLRELMVQETLQSLGRRGNLADLIEVADKLRLDDKQQAALRNEAAPEKVLTSAQLAALKELQGKPFDGRLSGVMPRAVVPDAPSARPVPQGTSTPVYAVTEAHIQAELKTTDEQKKLLDEAARTYRSALIRSRNAADAALKQTLSAEQLKRLHEITFQRTVRGVGFTAYLRGEAGKALLELTDDQEKRLATATVETAAALKKTLLSDDPIDKIASRVAEVGKEQEKKLFDLLSTQQQTKWKETFGVAFKDVPTPVPAPAPTTGPTPVFGGGFDFKNPDDMFARYLQSQNAKDVIEIDKVQSRMDPELQAKMKAFAAKQGNTSGKMTKDQFADFWTKEQIPFLEARASSPPAFQGFNPQPAAATLAYLLEADIQKDLALAGDQVAGVKDAQTKWEGKIKELAALPFGERLTKQTAAAKETDEAALALLTEPQKTRLEQLRLQQRVKAAASLVAIYRDPKIAEALKLTADDRARVAKTAIDWERVARLIRTEVATILGDSQPGQGGAVQELTTAFNEKVRAQQEKLLTAEQKVRWDTLVGKPFEGKFPAPAVPGGTPTPGGPGG